MNTLNVYLNELDSMLQITKGNHSTMIIAEDFNVKTIACSGTKMERRGTHLLDALIKNGIHPSGYIENTHFIRTG